jgi:hypothetical protein
MGNAPEKLNRIKGLPFFGLGGEYTTGNVFFVDSGIGLDDPNWGSSPEEPFDTIDYAIGQCTASNGDIIYVMPGHTESIAAASGINADVAGISIVGLGNGSNRPLITLGTATAATFNVGAADVKIKNLQFTSAIDSLGNFIVVGANGCTIEDCKFYTASTFEAICFINLTTTYDNLTVRRCEFLQPTDPGGTDAAASTGIIYCVDSENIYLEDIWFVGNFETGFFHNKTTKCQNLWMRRIYGYNALSTAVPITLVAASTGGITDSLITSPNATDIAIANIVGVVSDNFFIGRTANFGNDSGGGQLAAFGDAEAS